MKDKNIAAIISFFFGAFGIHRFYLGQVGLGITYLIFFWTGITTIIGIIDAIILLSMGQREFDHKYNWQYVEPDRRDRRDEYDRRRQDYRTERRDYAREQRLKERQKQREKERQKNREYRRRDQVRAKVNKPKKNPYKVSGIKKYKDFDYDDAIKDFTKALQIDARDVAVHFNLACAYSLTEDKEKAYFHLSEAVKYGFNDYPKIQDHDALAYLRIQDEYEAFVENGYKIDNSTGIEEVEEPVDPAIKGDMPNLLEQLQKLAELRERGLLTEAEFEVQKKRLLK